VNAFLISIILPLMLLIRRIFWGGEKTHLTVWAGGMKCNDCGYEWKSRKTSKPAYCPNCRSKNISLIFTPVK
jgi:predicted Zn-ribbon and HTH transcriptional regulator